MNQKYSEFKKSFIGDHKLNITAIDFDGNVLARAAILAKDNTCLQRGLNAVYGELVKKDLLIKLEQYEVVYPTVKPTLEI